ncbi:hypothetical protein [Actinoplanes sp. URMC 104]|uniref:hypothetical protein n=1 Tax=Actinoplanes sp. URMC 104 TaxID=3423409 RepID=UPI003F1C22F5
MTTPIGGEMLLWSDLDGTHGPAPAGGATLRTLLSVVSGRTLVAGPHAPELLTGLPSVTVLVRGATDADAYPGHEVLCGSLEKLAAPGSYDTVVALDGLDRLLSAEAAPHSWDETLALLLAQLRPGGRLLLGVPNLFGVDRLAALPAPPADSDWVVPDDRDPHRPAGHARLLTHLTAAGLRIVRDYAAYPSLSSPSVLLGPAILADPGLTGFVSATLTTAVQPAADALTDPVRLATAALRNNLAAELAPAWFVLAERLPAPPAGSDPVAAPGLDDFPAAASVSRAVAGSVRRRTAGSVSPPVAVSDAAPAPVSDAVAATDLDSSPAAAATDALRAAPAADGLPDAVIGIREVRLPAADLPRGRTLEDHLLAAAQRRDLPAMRQMLTAWQSGPAAGVPAAQIVVSLAEPTTAAVPAASSDEPATAAARAASFGEPTTATAPAASPAEPATGGRLVSLAPAGDPLEALRAFAAAAIAGGYAHLWPIPADEAELTAVLAGMTGREVEPSEVPPASRPVAHAVGDLLAARERLTRELAEARAKHEWYEKMLLHREAELKRVRQMNALLSATVPGKAATRLVGGLRAGKRAVRAVVRRARG